MKKIFQFFAVLAVLFVMGTAAFAQQRILFKQGARAAVVTGNLTGYKSRRVFVIRVRRGQTLRVEQLKSGTSNRFTTLSIKAPNGADVTDSDASCNNRKRVSPTRAGDYRIEVVECQKADAWRGSFRLKLRVD
jgi:hypothetical protein